MERGLRKARKSLNVAVLAGICGLLGRVAAAAIPVPAKVGPELQVNAFTSGNQQHPAVAVGGDGGFAVVWGSDGTTPLLSPLPPHGPGFYGRHFDASGTPGAEFRIDSGTFQFPLTGRVAADRAGNFVVVWSGHGAPDGTGGVILARRYDRSGTALGGELQVSVLPYPIEAAPDVAMDAEGGFFVVWTASDGARRGQILGRRYDPQGSPLTGEIQLTGVEYLGAARVTALPAGGFVATWEEAPGSLPSARYAARRFDAQGALVGAPFTAPGEHPFWFDRAAHVVPVAGESGEVSLVWEEPKAVISAQRYEESGAPLGGVARLLGPSTSGQELPTAAPIPGGGALLVWTEIGSEGRFDVVARAFDLSWSPQGDPFRVNTYLPLDQDEPAVAASPAGQLAVAWTSGDSGSFPFLPSDGVGQDGSGLGVYAQRFATSSCLDDRQLCLGEAGRFVAQVVWNPHGSGPSGLGHAFPLTSDTGAFWFFSPGNAELAVKVIDGRGLNDKFWVFYGSLSNVEYDLTVTDTATGEKRIYHNPPFTLASHADTAAFPLGSAPAVPAAAVLPPPVASAASAVFPGITLPCSPDPASLCLQDNRFTVTVRFLDPGTGTATPATAFPLSAESGYFWFFAPTNVELLVKVLDGRALNGSFWVLYGALSDVEYTITVTDGVTGAEKSYHNPAHTMASHADTSAFHSP